MTDRPVLILKQDVPTIYGFSVRQIKRWIVEKRIDHVHPSGPTGPCYVRSAQLDALIEASTSHAVGRASARGGQPRQGPRGGTDFGSSAENRA